MQRHLLHIILIALSLCVPSTLMAQGFLEDITENGSELSGYGSSHLIGASITHSRDSFFDRDEPDDADPGHTYGLLVEAAALPFRTIFGARGGMEASVGLGFPAFGSFLGGLRGNLGIMIVPVPLGPLRLSASAGAAIGGHRRFYVKPAATLNLRIVELQVSYMWNPHKASRVWDNPVPPGGSGVSETRLKGQLWFNIGDSGDSSDLSIQAIHVFVEQTKISSPTPEILEQKQIIPGTYLSGGAGVSF